MRSRWSDVGRGLVATAGLLALVGGVPAALALWVGWPLPTRVPRLDEVADALRDTYIPDEFLIKALALVCWLVWVELMVSLAVEAFAYAHGRQAGRVPVATSGIQRAAARLVATAALLGALTATRGVPELASRALHPPPTSHLVVAGELDDATAESKARAAEAGSPARASEQNPVYVVQPRDTLWRIAECHLGDPFRWPEIYELNRGAPQPDGQALRDADLIRPGWQLRLPADATGLAAPAAPGTSGAPATTPAPAPPRPTTSAPGIAATDPAGVDPARAGTGLGARDGMVLLDESDLRVGDRGRGTGGRADTRSGGTLASGGSRPGAAADTTTETTDAPPPTQPTRPGPQPTPVGSDAGGPGAGMVLLPDDALAPDESPPDDGWTVARGDDE